MAKVKAGTYCSIAAFLEAKDPELHSLLRATCTLDALDRAPRRTAGLTFLMPKSGHPCRAELAKLIESSNPKDLQKASDMLQAMIIRDYISKDADWKRTQDIPNFQFPSKKVVCKSATPSKVVINGDGGECVLSPYKDFIDGSRRGNLLIWLIESGTPSTTGDIAQVPLKGPAKPKSAKRGGYQPSAEEAGRARFLIALQKENQFASALLNGTICQCIQNCAAGLVMFLKANHLEEYKKVLGLIQRDESDFYILLEPHLRDGAQPILSDDCILSWYKSGATACSDYDKYCEEICADIEANLPNRGDCHDAAKNQVGITKLNIQEKYAEVAKNNSLGGVKLFENADLAKYYAMSPESKLIHDELRFFIPIQISHLRNAADKLTEFKDMVQWIGEKMHGGKTNINASADDELCRVFIHSTAFFYTPCTVAEMQDRAKSTISYEKASAGKLQMATDFLGFVHHKRIYSANAGDELKSAVDSLLADPQRITEEQKEKLRALLM